MEKKRNIKHKDAYVEKVVSALEELQQVGDRELAHQNADLLLCQMLQYMGYGEVVQAYNDIKKWYA